MRDLIQKTQQEWQQVKRQMQLRCLRSGKKDVAEKLSQCTMFRGDEGLNELVSLLFSPQGVEFALFNGFPSLAVARQFKVYDMEKLGVYVDCGKITLVEPQRAFLIGDTVAEVQCSNTASYRIYLMHGAQAVISADGYSVVRVEYDKSSQVLCHRKDNAKILI